MTAAAHIRPARAGDEPAMSALDRATVFSGHWSDSDYSDLLANRCGVLLKAECEGSLAGFLAGRIAAPDAELDNLAVAEAFRRRGIGGALLAAFLARVKAAGCTAVFLEVNERNCGALEFYGRAGFAPCGRRVKFYSGTDDAVLMRYDCA